MKFECVYIRIHKNTPTHITYQHTHPNHNLLGLNTHTNPFPPVCVCPPGLWFDLEISYSGSFLMTLETKMNLIRLGKEGEGLRIGELGKDG